VPVTRIVQACALALEDIRTALGVPGPGSLRYYFDMSGSSASPSAPPAAPDTPEGKLWRFLAQSLAGQAAVFLTIFGGGSYIAGVLVLSLKLEFRNFSWTPVLGQFPQDLVFFTALGDVILPCLIFGALCGGLLVASSIHPRLKTFYSKSRPRRVTYSAILTLLISAGLAWLPNVILSSYTVPGVANAWHVFTICLILNLFFIGLLFYCLNWLYKREFWGIAKTPLRHLRAMTLIAFAATPVAASIAASLPIPFVGICGPTSNSQGLEYFGGGNLIASNSSTAYVTVYVYPKDAAVVNRYIVAIPVTSAVIGNISTCKGIA
jgi:uncharacterized protein YjeT (DUF2065 family)